MNKYIIWNGILLVLICITVVCGITMPKDTTEYVYKDHVEETSAYAEALTRFVVDNYDELNSMDIGYD